jgi:ABC-type uncharacterized transport system permease subunit
MACVLVIGNWLLPLLYLGLLVDYGATFFLRTRTQARTPWLPAAVFIHAAMLVLWTVHFGRPPLANSQEILSVLALALAAVYGVVEFAGRDRRTGVFVLLLVFLFQYTSSVFLAGAIAGGPAAREGAAPLWLRLHVIPALVAYVALGFAGVYGFLYLLARRELRGHRFGMLFDRLPPLEPLDRMTWHVLLVGFVCMTITIASSPFIFGGGGAAGVSQAKVVTKIVTGSVAWLLCAAGVFGRWLGRWPPARVALVAVAGFLVVLALLAASGLLS